jgi:hypothetical protein
VGVDVKFGIKFAPILSDVHSTKDLHNRFLHGLWLASLKGIKPDGTHGVLRASFSLGWEDGGPTDVLMKLKGKLERELELFEGCAS